MDSRRLSDMLSDIVKNREIQRRKVQQNEMEKAGFREMASEFNAPVVMAQRENIIAQKENAKSIIQKLQDADNNSRRRFIRLDETFKKIPSMITASEESSRAPTPNSEPTPALEPNLKNYIDMDIDINPELLNQINSEFWKGTDTDPYFKMPNYYIYHPKDIAEALGHLTTISQSYGGKKGSSGSSEYDEIIAFVQAYKDSLKAIQAHISKVKQRGTGIFMNCDEMIKKLYTLIGSRVNGNTSDEVRNEAIDILDSLMRNKFFTKRVYNSIYKNYF